MAGYEADGIEAAKILLSLRDRKLQRWPEWVPRSSSPAASELWRRSEEPVEEEEVEEVEVKREVPEEWPKRRRSLWLVQVRGTAWSDVPARNRYGGSAGSGAPPIREDGARSQPRGREKPKVKVKSMVAERPETPPCYVVPAGSGPSTSGVDRVRSPMEKAQAKVAARKETMAASSPETPLDFAAGAGSGASSSGDDGARSRSSPAKRKALGASGSVGASSGDEGSSSPAKRLRADLDASAAYVEEPKKADEKVDEKATEEENYRDEKGHLLFDLNEDITPWQD